MTKIKVNVARPQTAPVKKPQAKPQTPTGNLSIFPKMSHTEQKRTKSIFGRMIDIVLEDIKSIFGKDSKGLQDKMEYEKFMEMVKK